MKRCILSKEGKNQFPQMDRMNPDRLGTILGESQDGRCWLVNWDGNKRSTFLWKGFIEDHGESLEPSPLAARTDVAEVTRDDHEGNLVLGSPQAAGADRDVCFVDLSRAPILRELLGIRYNDTE